MVRFLIAFTVFSTLPYLAQAAPAMRSDVCNIVGSVEKVEIREESYDKPESWRKAWGLPETQEYTDVTLRYVRGKLLEKGSMGGCDAASLPEVFQLRDDQKELTVGQCIEAQVQFSGDEFIIGHWLYDVTVLSDEECSLPIDN